MGRKLNVSTPTVINTELVPLSESFYIEADGNLEQWYYENDDRYAPNRKVTPMTLTPCISAFDADTQQTYTPSFYTVRWFEQAWDSTQGAYVETEITNTVDSLSADYVKVGDTLLVKKNVGYTHSVTITCKAQYIDPRDSGITYNISDSVLLTTNRDATVVTPELDVDCPSSQAFNPLVDNEIVNGNLQYKSEFTMKASSDYSSVLATNVAQYKIDPLGTEEVIPTNETAIVTSAPTMDIRYGDVEETDQTFMERQTSGGQATSITGNMAYVSKIKGNTVKFVQLFAPNLIPSGQNRNVSFLNNGNGSITVNGTPQGSTAVRLSTFTFNTSHKYYLKGSKDGVRVVAQNNSSWDVSVQGVFTPTTQNILGLFVSESVSYVTVWPSLFDLTAMGIDNLTTVEEVESWLATHIGLKSYYPYNEGELIPVNMSAIKSVGFNLWDGVYEAGKLFREGGVIDNTYDTYAITGFIPALPNRKYFITVSDGSTTYLCFYDANKNYIGGHIHTSGKSLTVTTPSGTAYIRDCLLIEHSSSYCINLSDSSRNGTYEAHWEAEQYLPITELKGKVNGQGDSVVIFPDGMKSAGSISDEIIVEDGVIKAIKRVGSVDLGSLSWNASSVGNGVFTVRFGSYGIKIVSNLANIICSKYDVYTSRMDSSAPDKIISANNSTSSYNDSLYIRDTAYSDAATFKTAMNGVMLYYELATPVEYIIDNMPRGQFEWYGISNNAEVLVETLPWYKSGQHTDTLVVDAMYGEEIRVVLRSRVSAGSDRLYPNKVYRSIVWQIPNVDTNTVSKNGDAVRSNTVEMEFETIVNVKGSVLSEQLKQDNLRFNWKIRKSNVSTETDKGWGKKKVIPASELRNVIGSSSSLASTFVLPYVYLLGAREAVVDNNEEVTDNGEVVYDRPVF